MERQKGQSERQIEAAQQEILRAQIQTGMGQAVEMLSKFLQPGFNFRIHLTEAKTSPFSTPSDLQEQSLAGVFLGVEGAVSGTILLLFSTEHAGRLAGLLLRQTPPVGLNDESLRSTLKEFGNIFASGVLFSLDDRMKLCALPLPPTLLCGPSKQLEEHWQQLCCQPDNFLVQARLVGDSPAGELLEGTVIFQIAAESLEQLGAAEGFSCFDLAVSC